MQEYIDTFRNMKYLESQVAEIDKAEHEKYLVR